MASRRCDAMRQLFLISFSTHKLHSATVHYCILQVSVHGLVVTDGDAVSSVAAAVRAAVEATELAGTGMLSGAQVGCTSRIDDTSNAQPLEDH